MADAVLTHTSMTSTDAANIVARFTTVSFYRMTTG